MTVAQLAQRELDYQKAREVARLRKAIRLVGRFPRDERAAAVYLAVSKENR